MQSSAGTTEREQGADTDRFGQQLQTFADWKARLTAAIQDYKAWLQRHERLTPETELRIFEALKALTSDQLRIACVAEFSRGKTELINAIFFADYGRRLLPSEAGRTTMCPTELFYDRDTGEAYIRLLPIETRLSDLTLAELKAEESYWTQLPLDIDSPDEMVKAFHEVVRTREVSLAEAEGLGLCDEGQIAAHYEGGSDGGERTVEIPVWRHALISFPHPLLRQGLVILDTPGLNALGTEPELTINMLPSAQAVLFVLAADTGVTRSDLEIWQNHIMAFRHPGQKGLVAILNKIDSLWDEMKSVAEIQRSINEQCTSSARALEIEAQSVLPVSAQKALVAKTRGDHELLERSNLMTLEALLANEILPARQQVIWESIIAGLYRTIEEAREPIARQIEEVSRQISEVAGMRGQSEEVVQQLIDKANARKEVYYESVRSFQLNRRKLALHARAMLGALDIQALDLVIQKTRDEMSGSWTTAGMKQGMSGFFTGVRDAMQIFARQAEETYQLILSVYRRFEQEYDLHATPPDPFPFDRFMSELDRLYQRCEEFRDSPMTTMTEQSFVVKKFFITLVSHARNTVSEANREADLWLREVVNPLIQQIQEKRNQIEQHMRTLSKIRESRENLVLQLRRLEVQKEGLIEQLASIDELHGVMAECSPAGDAREEASAAARDMSA